MYQHSGVYPQARVYLTLTRADNILLNTGLGVQDSECHSPPVFQYRRVLGQCRRREAEMTAASNSKTLPTVNVVPSHSHVMTHRRCALTFDGDLKHNMHCVAAICSIIEGCLC